MDLETAWRLRDEYLRDHPHERASSNKLHTALPDTWGHNALASAAEWINNPMRPERDVPLEEQIVRLK